MSTYLQPLSLPRDIDTYFSRQGLHLERFEASGGRSSSYLLRQDGQLLMFDGHAASFSEEELWKSWSMQCAWFHWHESFARLLLKRYWAAPRSQQRSFECWFECAANAEAASLLTEASIQSAGWPWSEIARHHSGLRLSVLGDPGEVNEGLEADELLALDATYLHPRFDPREPESYFAALRALQVRMERSELATRLPSSLSWGESRRL